MTTTAVELLYLIEKNYALRKRMWISTLNLTSLERVAETLMRLGAKFFQISRKHMESVDVIPEEYDAIISCNPYAYERDNFSTIGTIYPCTIVECWEGTNTCFQITGRAMRTRSVNYGCGDDNKQRPTHIVHLFVTHPSTHDTKESTNPANNNNISASRIGQSGTLYVKNY